MLCVFEVLHFVPLALIAVSLFGLKNKSNALFASMLTIMGIAGLIGGNHSHIEHDAFFGMIDPCYAYMISIAYGMYSFAKLLRAKFAKVNA